jgi:hypothetical protein
MGATNVLGAYPFHFHMLGDVSNAGRGGGSTRDVSDVSGAPRAPSSYITDSAVYRSFYRCGCLLCTRLPAWV